MEKLRSGTIVFLDAPSPLSGQSVGQLVIRFQIKKKGIASLSVLCELVKRYNCENCRKYTISDKS